MSGIGLPVGAVGSFGPPAIASGRELELDRVVPLDVQGPIAVVAMGVVRRPPSRGVVGGYRIEYHSSTGRYRCEMSYATAITPAK